MGKKQCRGRSEDRHMYKFRVANSVCFNRVADLPGAVFINLKIKYCLIKYKTYENMRLINFFDTQRPGPI